MLALLIAHSLLRLRLFNRRHPILAFILGTTIGFPIEHILYDKVWPFTLVTKLLGLQ
jgi:hypothetical protein